jgi:hypothetical protein
MNPGPHRSPWRTDKGLDVSSARADLPASLVRRAIERIGAMVEEAVDRVKAGVSSVIGVDSVSAGLRRLGPQVFGIGGR